MTDLTVKFFNSGMTGAPQIANNWGDLVTMLDACIVNGFALKAIDTMTFADGIATATISAGHAYRLEQVLEIAADQPEYNGQFRVIATTATTFTFAATGTPVSPATSATSLSAKVAPLGWEKAFAGTDKALPQQKSGFAAEPADRRQPQDARLYDDVGQVGECRHRRRLIGHRHHRRRAGPVRSEQPDAELEAGAGQPVGLAQVVPRTPDRL